VLPGRWVCPSWELRSVTGVVQVAALIVERHRLAATFEDVLGSLEAVVEVRVSTSSLRALSVRTSSGASVLACSTRM
jgi:hypothetical protein